MESADCFLADVIGPEVLRHGLKRWIEAAAKRLHPNKLAIALANKLVRIAWGVLHYGRDFEARNDVPNASQSA